MEDIQKADLIKGRRYKIGAAAAPVALAIVPASVTMLLLLLAASGPPVAAVILFAGIILTVLGFLSGVVISAILLKKNSDWTKEMRDRIAANGIRAEQIEWFRKELKPSEKRALKAVSARDLLLADAYRETLASRLTATRILRSSRRELLLAKQRQNSVKRLKSSRAGEFAAEIERDIAKIDNINNEAKLMLAEAESRLQMIEAATARTGTLADSELALKKLSARTAQLPLALESAKMSEEIRQELENEGLE
jgi:hypothetical protein